MTGRRHEGMRSLFLDKIFIEIDDGGEEVWSNGQHRSQAMLDQGVFETVVFHYAEDLDMDRAG
jgi:hypothetical protein